MPQVSEKFVNFAWKYIFFYQENSLIIITHPHFHYFTITSTIHNILTKTFQILTTITSKTPRNRPYKNHFYSNNPRPSKHPPQIFNTAIGESTVSLLSHVPKTKHSLSPVRTLSPPISQLYYPGASTLVASAPPKAKKNYAEIMRGATRRCQPASLAAARSYLGLITQALSLYKFSARVCAQACFNRDILRWGRRGFFLLSLPES